MTAQQRARDMATLRKLAQKGDTTGHEHDAIARLLADYEARGELLRQAAKELTGICDRDGLMPDDVGALLAAIKEAV